MKYMIYFKQIFIYIICNYVSDINMLQKLDMDVII